MEGIELGGDQQFCLRWNNFQANITSQFETLRDDEDFVDVTLACEGHRLEAHKVVLSACSPYFKELFKSNPCPHPIIFMRDCELVHVTALLEFMYAGEVNIAQAQLTAFLRTAEALQIRGLTDSSSSSKSKTESKHANQKSPPSQLRNLLSAKPSNTTSSSKAVSQNAELFNNDGDKTASSPNTQHRKLSSDDPDNDANGSHGNRNSANDNVFPTSSQMRPNNEHKEKNNYGAVRLKSDLALMERKNEDYEKKDSDGSNTTNEDDNQRTGKINPFAVSGGGYTDTEMLNNMLEPKMEMPDYASDDDMKQERAAFNSENFYDATNSLANPFASLQGSVDFMAGLNQDYTEDGIEGNGFLSSRRARQLLSRPRVPWLEQVRRVPLVGERMENTGPPRLIKLGEGVELREEQLRGVKWSDYRKLTRGLAAALFSPAELATSSVTGQRWSRAGQEARPTKPPLDRRRVQALISYVSKRFPGVEVSRIKQVLAYKCKENCAALRMRNATESTNAMLPNLPPGLGMSLGLSLMRPDTDLQQPPPPPQHPPDDDSGPGTL